jgi:hypothetical protein
MDNDTQEIEAPEIMSRKLVDSIIAAPDGFLKNASEASGRMVRRRIRENGYSRLILPYKPVGDADLARLPNTELPVVIEEMEPDSPGAKSISFNDSADTAFYRADKFVVYFSKISTPGSVIYSLCFLFAFRDGTASTAARSDGKSRCV